MDQQGGIDLKHLREFATAPLRIGQGPKRIGSFSAVCNTGIKSPVHKNRCPV
jgi:hypothetical protein